MTNIEMQTMNDVPPFYKEILKKEFETKFLSLLGEFQEMLKEITSNE